MSKATTRFEPGFFGVHGRCSPSVAFFRRSPKGRFKVETILALLDDIHPQRKTALRRSISDLRDAIQTAFARDGAEGVVSALRARGYEPVRKHTSLLRAGVPPEELDSTEGV